jgi:1,4-dihydroxy-2-naphthoyl-CoA hydrolase
MHSADEGGQVPLERALAGFEPVIPVEDTFDRLVGLEDITLGAGRAQGRVRVDADHLGIAGVVHGGIYAAVAETLASLGTTMEVLSDGLAGTGVNNSTHVVADVRSGLLTADARCTARATYWLWDVEFRDADARVCARSTVTVAATARRRS